MFSRFREWSKQLFAQAQHWAKSEHCIRDLTIITIASCIIFPFPVEALLIAIIMAMPRRWIRATLAIVVGSVVGALFWYLLGSLMLNQAIKIVQFFSPGDDWATTQAELRHEGALFLGVAAFTPGLFRIGMVAAGAVGFNPVVFMVAVAIGRGIRFFLEALLLRLFGDRLRTFMEKYFDLISVGLGAGVFLLLIIIKLVKS